MKNSRQRLSLTSLLVAALAASGCSASPRTPDGVAVLIDISQSTAGVRTSYLERFDQLLAALQPGDRLVVIPAGAISLVARSTVDVTFPATSVLWTNPLTHARRMRAARGQARQAVAALLEHPPAAQTRGTALIDGLIQAQEELKPFPADHRVVALISDMVEQSDLLDLTGLQEAGIKPALDRITAAGRMPDLAGARVYVAGLDAAASLPPALIIRMRSFWTQLFTTAGARLESWGPAFRGLRAEPAATGR